MARGPNKNLLSKSYKAIMGIQLPEDLKQKLGLDDGCTYADAIGYQVVKRALGLVPDDRICFRAITELRETTEGKTPDKVIAAGTNAELSNLARIMQGEPAPPDSDLDETDKPDPEDKLSEDSERNFHS
jgi:hypothetical protein